MEFYTEQYLEALSKIIKSESRGLTITHVFLMTRAVERLFLGGKKSKVKLRILNLELLCFLQSLQISSNTHYVPVAEIKMTPV